jgi:hypothetical protein
MFGTWFWLSIFQIQNHKAAMRKVGFLIILIGLFSCRKEVENCFRSTGEIEEEFRSIGSFQNLRLEDNLNLTWHFSDSAYVKIRAGKNLIPKITTAINGNELVIRNQNSCNWTRSYSRPFEIDLFSPAPYLIRHEGFGKISCADSLRSSPLTIQHYAAGDINLNVAVGELYVDFNSPGECLLFGLADKGAYSIQNFGKFKLDGVQIKECDVNMEGENDARMWVSDKIRAEHKSTRTIFLKGNPVRQVQLRSSGKIVPIP